MNLLRHFLPNVFKRQNSTTALPLGFERSRWPALGLRAGGILRYRIGRREDAVRVSISWDALSRVRTDLSRGGKGYNEELVVPKLLAQWGCERLTEIAQASGELPGAGLVLEAEDWPAGPEATDLLVRCGLL